MLTFAICIWITAVAIVDAWYLRRLRLLPRPLSIANAIQVAELSRVPASSCLHATSPGKVDEPSEWIRCVSNSLQKFYGKSLYEEMSVAGPENVHSNEQYVVVSHGTQVDPIYNYANKAGLICFGYTEEEFVQSPSRKSAPEGVLSEDRNLLVQHVLNHGWTIIPQSIRQNKDGERFLVQRILFFNVYDDDGNRTGQAATFDRYKVEMLPVDKAKTNEK
ncbi:hypothetical protein MPSEU_000519900 [Mayamaea pseudoterrestris]|nr:hypothetical protein MPSEU_000519900 [Mayamaea pseudoterrestris]